MFLAFLPPLFLPLYRAGGASTLPRGGPQPGAMIYRRRRGCQSYSNVPGNGTPTWLRQAKFGIWFHYGPQANLQSGDWAAQHMYQQGAGAYSFHTNYFGHPTTNGYKDVIRAWAPTNLGTWSILAPGATRWPNEPTPCTTWACAWGWRSTANAVGGSRNPIS